MYVLGPRLLALPLAVQVRDCGHYRESTPDDHDIKACLVRTNRLLDAYFAGDRRTVDRLVGVGRV